jgi:hypothetical protein
MIDEGKDSAMDERPELVLRDMVLAAISAEEETRLAEVERRREDDNERNGPL